MPSLRRILVFLVVVSFVAMWGWSIHLYGTLPGPRFPVHFDAAGAPDHFAEKSAGTWFALPILFTVVTLLFAAMAVFIPAFANRYPTLVNVPEKATFVKLPPAARLSAIDPMRDLALAMPLALHLLCDYVQWGWASIAAGRAQAMSPFPVVLVLLYSFATLAFTVVRMRNSVKNAANASA